MIARAAPLSLVLCVLVPALTALGQEAKIKPLSREQLREEEAYTVGVQAYVYGFPVVEMYRTRQRMVYDPANKNRTPLNQFRHARQLADHTYAGVVSPNNDTLYSGAWLDLAAEPMVLDVPAIKQRYYSFQLLDFFTNNFAIVGRRTTDGKPATYAIVGPRWKGKLPAGVMRLDAPTNVVWLLGRTLVEGKDDLGNVHALQDRYRLVPLSVWTTSDKVVPKEAPPPAPPDLSNPLKFFEILNAGLRENPPPARDAALVSLFGRIGVGPDKTFRANALDPATAKGLERALALAKQLITDSSRRALKKHNGWNLPAKDIGSYGDDFLLRAQVAAWGLAALSPEEAVYFTAYHDEDGKPLHGKHRYVLRFEKGQLPAVAGFWSLTMYRLPELWLVNNPLERYAIGDRTKDIRRAADGVLEIFLQHDSPGKERESNWLPAPAGEFSLNLRAYLPRPELLDGTWKIPPVRRVKR